MWEDAGEDGFNLKESWGGSRRRLVRRLEEDSCRMKVNCEAAAVLGIAVGRGRACRSVCARVFILWWFGSCVWWGVG